MTGEQFYEYYSRQNTDYASVVKMLPYPAGSFENAYRILERCRKEKKEVILLIILALIHISPDEMSPY